MRVIVAGALASKPGYGGEAWVRLAWVKGLQSLGARVLFLEEVEVGEGVADGIHYFRRVCRAFGLEDTAALLGRDGRGLAGLAPAEVADFAADADLLVNLSGHLRRPDLFAGPRRRAYVDLDPGYTQLWHESGAGDLRLGAHDVHFTVGTNLGHPICELPAGGLRWIPVLPPVLLDQWPRASLPPLPTLRFTTVASWRGAYGAVERGARRYGLKAHEFRKLAPLPRRVPRPCEIALDIHPADGRDRDLLEQNGWALVDPADVAATPGDFRDYVTGSGAELSPAQGIYVETRSGWFSDRSAHYLASGRPVVVQDTGFGRTLPVGEGLLAFRELDDAVTAAGAVAREPRRHGEAARQIAERWFDARVVLSGFLDRALPPTRPRPAARVPRSDPPAATPGRGPGGSAGAVREPRTVLVSGMVARVPGQGGAVWAVLQYVLGLRALGHRAILVEEIEPDDLLPHGTSFEASRNVAYFRDVVRSAGLEGDASLLLRGTDRCSGLSRDALRRRLGSSTVLLNLSGTFRDAELRGRIPVRVYVDLDPAFTQLWHAGEGLDLGFEGHTHFVTVGLEVGRPGCDIPTCGLPWIHTLPPVVLERWAPAGAVRHDALTTVGNWRGYGSIRWRGRTYGQKAHGFRQLFDLPCRVPGERFRVALAIHSEETEDRAALESHGWELLDPADVAATPERYRRFVRGSAMEIGVAKTGYVASRCGWFSDRSACYLASGRPVLAQDTGFSAHLPTGEGLLGFRTAEEAARGVRAVRAEYPRHARAARRVAEAHLDARRVLSRLLEAVTS